MDFHRCRFVPYPPQSINALAFSHASNPDQNTPLDLRLAIGRANGDIELWNPLRGDWFQEKVLRGSAGRTIEQLGWTQDHIVEDVENADSPLDLGQLRLFSSGGSPSITEWDLSTGISKRHVPGNYGDIWCFAAQPQWNSTPNAKGSREQIAASPSQLLAAGCSDGTVVLFSTAEEDLRYDRVAAQPPSKKSRVISLTWRDRNHLVIGYEESTIRVVDIRNRRVIRDMSLGKPADGSNSVVWALKCMADGTILSGDSSGELKIWDAQTLALVQRLKAHAADILDLTASDLDNTIYTCGVDRRTVAYRPVAAQANSKHKRWQQFTHRRFHQHDVKAIAAYQSKDLNVAVSGGMDTVPVVLPIKNLGSEYHRALSHLPQKPQMSISAEARLLLTWWGKNLFLWSLPKHTQNTTGTDSFEGESGDRRLLARLQLKGEENISSAHISHSGDLVVAATSSTVKLFQLRQRTTDGELEVRTRQIELPTSLRNFGASSVRFSPDNKWLLAVRLSNVIILTKINRSQSPTDKPRVHQRVVKLSCRTRNKSSESNHTLGQYMNSLNAVAFSSDSRVLAAGDLSGVINAWILEGHENLDNGVSDPEFTSKRSSNSSSDSDSDSDSGSDSDDETDSPVIQGQKWIKASKDSDLPKLDAAILELTFKPSRKRTAGPVSGPGDGNIGLHATRQNPHPVSHETPSHASAHLVAITSTHQVVELDVLACKLTNWSRRNPPSLLPADFKNIKDRILGTWWDCNMSVGYERLWMYGTSWMYMLDMSQDLDTTQAQYLFNSEKMGRHEVTETSDKQSHLGKQSTQSLKVGHKRKRTAGAGDEIEMAEKYTATLGGDEKTGLLSPVSEYNEDDDEAMNSLALARRLEVQSSELVTTEKNKSKPPAQWHTFRYRSIFGVGSLGVTSEGTLWSDDQMRHPEVVVVERPMFDVELLPRFDGGQDWD